MWPPSLDHARLLALFRRLALIAAPVASFELSGCGPCAAPNSDRIILLRDPDAETQALIDACRDPATHLCTPLCTKVAGGAFFDHCEVHPDRDGYVQVHVGVEGVCAGGRRPQHVSFRALADSGVGAFFAHQFQLEAASVPAFRALGAELDGLGAPPVLAADARAAVRDEVRHARSMATLTRRHGVRPRAPRVAPSTPRGLVDFAVENVVEGCVRETYGALLASVQARRSVDPQVRAIMRGIAVDEARHAALAFAVDNWVATRLSATERRALEGARAVAVEQLERHAGGDWTPALDATAGLPPPALVGALLGQLRRTLWA